MTAASKRCVFCGHAKSAHRDYRHQCEGCSCRKFLARGDIDGILQELETIEGQAK